MKKELVVFLLSVGFYTSQVKAVEYLNNLSPEQLEKLINLSKQLSEKRRFTPPVEKNGCIISSSEKELDNCIISSGKKLKLIEKLNQSRNLEGETNINDYLNSLNIEETIELNEILNDTNLE